jgi:hypothetical protein
VTTSWRYPFPAGSPPGPLCHPLASIARTTSCLRACLCRYTGSAKQGRPKLLLQPHHCVHLSRCTCSSGAWQLKMFGKGLSQCRVDPVLLAHSVSCLDRASAQFDMCTCPTSDTGMRYEGPRYMTVLQMCLSALPKSDHLPAHTPTACSKNIHLAGQVWELPVLVVCHVVHLTAALSTKEWTK